MGDRNRREIASGYAGDPIARQQDSLGALREAQGGEKASLLDTALGILGGLGLGAGAAYGVNRLGASPSSPSAPIGALGTGQTSSAIRPAPSYTTIRPTGSSALATRPSALAPQPPIPTYAIPGTGGATGSPVAALPGGNVPKPRVPFVTPFNRTGVRDESGNIVLNDLSLSDSAFMTWWDNLPFWGGDETEALKILDHGPLDPFERGQGLREREDTTSVFDTALQRELQSRFAPYAQELGELENEYMDRIGALEDELAGYRGGLAGTNAAYASYADDADAILREAAEVEAEALPATAVVEEVDRTYNEFDGAMQETLQKIDSNGNDALAKQMSNELRDMQTTFTDALRADITDQDTLHQLAGAQAQALANMAWKDDLYNAERSRFELELQINKMIADQQEEIDNTRQQMNDDMQKINDEFASIQVTPDELWNRGMGDFLAKEGFNAAEQQDIVEMWDQIFANNPLANQDYGMFKQEISRAVNLENLSRLGMLPQMLNWATASPENQAEFDKYIVHSISDSAFVQIGQMAGIDAAAFLGRPDVELASINDTEYKTLLDLWGYKKDFSENYDQYTNVDPQVLGGSVSFNPAGNFAYPVAGENWWSGGGFGKITRSDGTIKDHQGIDIHAPHGTPIVAATGGVVVREGENGVGGWTITIQQPDGQYTHYYAHMQARSSLRKGDTVSIGDMIGQVGDSGNAAGGNPHLHYGIRDTTGRPVNPSSWLGGVNTAAGTSAPNLRTSQYDPVAAQAAHSAAARRQSFV